MKDYLYPVCVATVVPDGKNAIASKEVEVLSPKDGQQKKRLLPLLHVMVPMLYPENWEDFKKFLEFLGFDKSRDLLLRGATLASQSSVANAMKESYRIARVQNGLNPDQAVEAGKAAGNKEIADHIVETPLGKLYDFWTTRRAEPKERMPVWASEADMITVLGEKRGKKAIATGKKIRKADLDVIAAISG